MEKHYWLEMDHRFEGLEAIFDGFNKALETFHEKFNQYNWYDGDFYREETELIYGVVLVSLQNYINKSCVDFLDEKLFGYKQKYQFYDKNSKIIDAEISQIRLIIELANYFKHRDDERDFIKSTKDCLTKLGLMKFYKDSDERFEDELIFEGLLLINSHKIDINELLQIVKKWRDDTYAEAHNHNNVLNVLKAISDLQVVKQISNSECSLLKIDNIEKHIKF